MLKTITEPSVYVSFKECKLKLVFVTNRFNVFNLSLFKVNISCIDFSPLCVSRLFEVSRANVDTNVDR